MTNYEGHLDASGLRVAIVAARFNDFVVSRLVGGARDALKRHGLDEAGLSLAWVPGAFELPLVAARLAARPDIDAVICLGAVIRGATPHFDYVCAECAKGVAAAGQATGKPVIFGVLTTDSLEQAIERAGSKAGNKGWDAALAAIEMAQLLRQLEA